MDYKIKRSYSYFKDYRNLWIRCHYYWRWYCGISYCLWVDFWYSD